MLKSLLPRAGAREWSLPSNGPGASLPSSFTIRRLIVPLLLCTTAVLGLAGLWNPGSTTTIRRYWTKEKKQAVALSDEIDWARVGRELPLNATLEERLKDWESAPMVEPATWVGQSMKTCPAHRIAPRQNRQQLDQSHLLWSSLNTSAIAYLRSCMMDMLREAKTQGRLDAYGEGRGLVFTAGNVDTFSRVLVTLKILHKYLKSPLPSEIFSFPGELPSEEVRLELEKYGASLKTVESATRDSKRAKNYHIKATAIIESRFREVLYLDSDNMLSASLAEKSELTSNMTIVDEKWGDPSGLWESKAYQRLGVMFWPDYWKTSADNPIWAIAGVVCRDEWEQEAGQILIDKKLHLDALILSQWMLDGHRWRFWYNISDGDKDIFRYAFLSLRKRWGVPGRYVSGGMFPRATASGECMHTMLQADHRGRPMFVHANLLKQIPSGVGRGFSWALSKTVRVQPNTLQHIPHEVKAEYLPDLDVDCDMLANAGHDGRAIKPAPPAVRRRAAIERGIRTFFHGGGWSALCVDMTWDDPRTEEEISAAKKVAGAALRRQKGIELSEGEVPDDSNVDVSYTMTNDGLEMKWESPLGNVEWKDDVRLKDFENAFFDPEIGGVLNSFGF